MHAGCICVSTYTQGIDELIDNNVNGYIVDNDTKEISSKINEILLYDNKELRSIRNLAREKIQKYFNASASMKKYIKLWGLDTK